MSLNENARAGGKDPEGGSALAPFFGWGEPRTTVLRELRKNHSILRSETTVALSRLRLSLPGSPSLLDAGGPTVDVWEAMSIARHRALSMNLSPERKPDVIGDLDSSWPLKSDAFDLILSSYVLEHLREPSRFFGESFRCLKEGGLLVLSTVLLHEKHGSPQDYFRFTDDGLLNLARGAGYDAQTKALLAGPLQAILSLVSPFLIHPWLRTAALLTARTGDRLVKRLLPFVGENWCSGYLLLARKPTRPPAVAR